MSLWQTKIWQQMLKKSGQISEFFEVENIFVEKRSIGLGQCGLFILWSEEKKITKKLQEKLIDICRKEKCLFVQIETLDYKILEEKNKKFFKNWYYKKFIPPYTCVIDLEKTEEEILGNMKPKGRYNIRLARKKWVTVKKVEKTEKNIQKYFEIMQETTSRDNFSGNTKKYYETFLTSLNKSELFFAYFEEKIIAGGIFVFWKKTALYYYGASSNSYRNLMAPYLLQWEAITYAQKKWCKIYDFLGIASPDEDNSPLAGVTDFKKKLSKDVRKVSKSYIFINKKWKYFLINFLRKIKR